MDRYTFSLRNFHGKTVYHSPMIFACRKMRDEFARQAHADFALRNGVRVMVRKSSVKAS